MNINNIQISQNGICSNIYLLTDYVYLTFLIIS